MNFFDSVIGDILRSIDGKCRTAPFTLISCTIDILSFIENGDKKNSFNAWMKMWLHPINSRYDDVVMYGLRNAFVHTHGSSKILRKNKVVFNLRTGRNSRINPLPNLGRFHTNSNDVILLCLSDFLSEIILASNRFFNGLKKIEVNNPSDLGLKKIKNRLDEQIKNKNETWKDGKPILEIQTMSSYKQIHKALEIFDRNQTPTIEELTFELDRILYPESNDDNF